MNSGQLRTVRLLDREANKAYEERTVGGFKLEKGVALPKRPAGRLDTVLRTMEVGESFEHKARIGSTAKRYPGRKFTVRALGGGKYRVWRVA